MISCSSTLASSAPGHVGEGDLRRVAREQLRLGLAEREGAAAAGLQLAQQEEPEAEDHDPRQRRDDDRRDAALGLLGQDRNAGVLQPLDEHLAVRDREQHGEALGRPAVLRDGSAEVALQPLAVEHLDPGDVALVELPAELGVGELLGRDCAAGSSSGRAPAPAGPPAATARGSCSGSPSWCAGGGRGVGLPFIPGPR